MSDGSKPQRLKKELTLLNVYAIATGSTLSAGFFLLPGLAAASAGPAIILCYLLAAVPLVPAMLSMVELGTAMPRAGGAYYFLDRSMGPLMGTIGGIGTWLSLMLKTAFALIGMGAYMSLFVDDLQPVPVAIGFAVFFMVINLWGAKASGFVQIILVAGLLGILSWFIGRGLMVAEWVNVQEGFFDKRSGIFATAGMVYISYVGVTKVASVSEEVKDPERNLPLGMFLAFFTAIIVYTLGTYVMVAVVPARELAGDLTPVATVAQRLTGGTWAVPLVSCAAMFAFFSVANAGILSASRYPLAMSRDNILPRMFRHLSKKHIPTAGIVSTTCLIIAIILCLPAVKIAKLASAFQLMMFALICLAVIIMRESKIESYDPGYKSPFYPWMQIAGIFIPFVFIAQMGVMPILFSAGLVVVAVAWFIIYARHHVKRSGAILHVFARLGTQRYEELDSELRGILKEKGLRRTDPFDTLVAAADVIDIDEEITFDLITDKVSVILARQIADATPESLKQQFLEGSKIGMTPVSAGAALPHLRLHGLVEPQMVIVRAHNGISLKDSSIPEDLVPSDTMVNAAFYLISPDDQPGQHLRILAQLARHIDDDYFMSRWMEARDEQELKEILLRDEHFFSLHLTPDSPASVFIGKPLHDVQMPEGILIAMINRDGNIIVPRGNTTLLDGDQLTIIGEPKHIREIEELYGRQQAHGPTDTEPAS